MKRLFVLLGACLALFLPTTATACGPDTDCALGERVYRIYTPPEIKHPGAIVFAHGYRGSARGVMRVKGLRAMADRLGVPLVAAQSYAQDWRIPGTPADPANDGSIEYDYFAQLKDRLADTHGIDTDRILMSGFSAGGMMVWQLACGRGDTFAAYAPIAGTFWAPMPTSCESAPVTLFHTHGTSDKMVPLTGRFVTEAVSQGDVPNALEMLIRDGGFTPSQAPSPEGLDCEAATAPGHVMEFCTHPGGHSLKASYIERVWNRLLDLQKL